MKALWTLNLIRNTAKCFFRQRGTESVAVLAYASLIGIVPLLAVMLSLFSITEWFAPIQQLIMDMLMTLLMPESQPVIQKYLTRFAESASNLAIPGLVVMFATTLILLRTVDQKINAIWDLDYHRSWWGNLLSYLGISLFGPLLLGFSLLLSTYLFAVPVNVEWWPGLVSQLLPFTPLILNIVGFMLLYRFVPVAKVRWHQAWWVGVMTALQVEILKFGFSWYLKMFPTYDLVYGALAAVPVFLFWLYLMWFIVIWNACVLAQLNTEKSAENEDEKR